MGSGCGDVGVGVVRWVWGGECGYVWVWGGGCEWEGGFGCGEVVWVWRWWVWGVRCGCDVEVCRRWVQVMEHVKIEGVEM